MKFFLFMLAFGALLACAAALTAGQFSALL